MRREGPHWIRVPATVYPADATFLRCILCWLSCADMNQTVQIDIFFCLPTWRHFRELYGSMSEVDWLMWMRKGSGIPSELAPSPVFVAMPRASIWFAQDENTVIFVLSATGGFFAVLLYEINLADWIPHWTIGQNPSDTNLWDNYHSMVGRGPQPCKTSCIFLSIWHSGYSKLQKLCRKLRSTCWGYLKESL